MADVDENTVVIGRTTDAGPTGLLGRYRARDGSEGAPVAVDLDRPHVGLVVGKRGSGKSYTLGVLAEALARADGVTPVVVDPMGAFRGLDGAGLTTVEEPRVPATAVEPRAWCDLLGLDPASGAGALLWQAADARETVAGMREYVADADVPAATRRATANHLRLAASWNVFGEGFAASDLDGGAVLDLTGVRRAPANAVVAAVADALYDARTAGRLDSLPWLLVDEAHAFDGVAARPLRRLLTRGRQPGVGTVAATQRPSALPEAGISQADLLVTHRLTSRADREALAAARPSYMAASFDDRMPTGTGEALVVDDATESVHALRVRERRTPHGGASPRASAARGRAANSASVSETVE
ncbi:MAG: ATP-binding protein [Haloarculaceae archaeon]